MRSLWHTPDIMCLQWFDDLHFRILSVLLLLLIPQPHLAIYVFNPITKETVKLPSITFPQLVLPDWLAGGVETNKFSSGFGFHDLEFKLVVVIFRDYDFESKINNEVQVLAYTRQPYYEEKDWHCPRESFGFVSTPGSHQLKLQYELGAFEGQLSVIECSSERYIQVRSTLVGRLPDASLLLSTPDFSSHEMSQSDHHSRVAAAIASWKRESNGSAASSYPRSKFPRSNLPHSRNVLNNVGGLLIPPQLSGRSNVVTEDLSKLFARTT
ncbi:hypothetical protein IFM89_007060 [Coptis chinensis]|uniref:Uncharacterized protein n=1 Tax=Coptis chinensis TaxID=261450 RepID=A0A835HL85_9MAGN|nr:hypothetical protein IFM89_007060 [Coptis chinensis]